MRFRLTAISAALLLSPLVQAAAADMFSASAAIANITTTASYSHPYLALENAQRASLLSHLSGGSGTIKRPQLETMKQGGIQADQAWLKASSYNFQQPANQQAGIALLSAFSALPPAVIGQNLATVEQINQHASEPLRHQALVDAEGLNYLFFLADALGPRLGQAFIRAYDNGEIGKAAALIKASEVSTSAAKAHFAVKRPFLIPGNHIKLVPDTVVVKDNLPYSADGGAFPSGHTNTGYTDALLLAQMIPERYVSLIDRGARYGYSRVVLGVHYPLDVMGSRMVAQRNVAHYLNDPAYRVLFKQAQQQLRQALEKECGTTVAQCAQNPAQDDPYRAARMQTFYRFTMTYGFPADAKADKAPLQVADGAEVLLESVLPDLSAAQRRELMVHTALGGGYPLSGDAQQSFWQRLNLHDAATAGLAK